MSTIRRTAQGRAEPKETDGLYPGVSVVTKMRLNLNIFVTI